MRSWIVIDKLTNKSLMSYVLALFYEEVKTNHGQTAYAMLSINQSQSFSL